MIRTKLLNSSGVYQIQSKSNGKRYIGSSINIKRRIKYGHLRELKNGEHWNKYLLKHIHKYGIEDLTFSVLECCSKEKLIEREQYWIDIIKPEFNLNPKAGSCFGRVQSNKEREKRRVLWGDKEFKTKVAKTMKESHPDFKGENHPMYGKHHKKHKKHKKYVHSEKFQYKTPEYKFMYSKIYDQIHKEHIREYREAHKERIREYYREYYRAHKKDMKRV